MDLDNGPREHAHRDAAPDLAIEELDRLATTAYMTGRDAESTELWGRGYRRCSETGDLPRATRFGARLALSLAFKGDTGWAAGWIERSRRLLDDACLDSVERGFVEYAAEMCRMYAAGDIAGARATGMCRIFSTDDIAAARTAFGRAAKIGERFGDPELLTLAGIGQGRCLIYLGEIVKGMTLLDEAMVAVEAREISPMAIGEAYCTALDACHEVVDDRRWERWTDSFTRWCDTQADLLPYRGHCLLYRAALMLIHGDWSDGLRVVQDARSRLATKCNPLTLGAAHYVEAELHRLHGDFAAAQDGYQRANALGCQPQPGLARLRMEEGRIDVAAAQFRRVLAETMQPTARARMLCAATEIFLAAGDITGARCAADELSTAARKLDSQLLQAHAALAIGRVSLAQGDPARALSHLRRAAGDWITLQAPHQHARTRVLIGAACEALGDLDGAEMERRAANAILEELGAGARLPTAAQSAPGGLTARESEVLARLATGKTNRAIAAELCISEKTVASHLNHIFTKLGLSSRSAATAYVYEHGLR